MAFFDGWGKKLSQAGQSAVQKTKEMTDIAKINGQISSEEKKINNSYIELGKLYATLHAEDYESEFAPLIDALRESEKKIEECKQQIQQIKGVIRCESCGAEIANNVAFCSSCGAAVVRPEPAAPAEAEVAAEPAANVCPGCGAEVDATSAFCTQCGAKMN